MRSNLIPLLTIVALSGCRSTSSTAQTVAVPSDLGDMQGLWIAEAYERQGKPVGPGLLRNTRVVIEQDTLELVEGGEFGELVTFQLDEGKEPKQITMRLAKGPQAGQLALGIYDLEGDTMRICWAEPGKPRPSAFTTLNDTAFVNLTLRWAGPPE